MPSNTRGKLKDHCSGVHKNTEAIKAHCAAAVELVGDKNQRVKDNFISLAEMADVIDGCAKKLYSLL